MGISPPISLVGPLPLTPTPRDALSVPPQVQPGPRLLKVLAGEALDLNCMAEGQPEPRLSWFKDGVSLQGRGPEGSVQFAAVEASDAGRYRCEASNSAGADAWELELRVLGESPSAGLCGVQAICPFLPAHSHGAVWDFPGALMERSSNTPPVPQPLRMAPLVPKYLRDRGWGQSCSMPLVRVSTPTCWGLGKCGLLLLLSDPHWFSPAQENVPHRKFWGFGIFPY